VVGVDAWGWFFPALTRLTCPSWCVPFRPPMRRSAPLKGGGGDGTAFRNARNVPGGTGRNVPRNGECFR